MARQARLGNFIIISFRNLSYVLSVHMFIPLSFVTPMIFLFAYPQREGFQVLFLLELY